MAKREGRPEYQPTEKDQKFVQVMASVGTKHQVIAAVIGIAPKTLRKHFRSELDTAMPMANAKVIATQFTMATSGDNFPATKFWLESRCGWQATQAHRLVDGEGKDRDLGIEAVRAYMRSAPEEGEAKA